MTEPAAHGLMRSLTVHVQAKRADCCKPKRVSVVGPGLMHIYVVKDNKAVPHPVAELIAELGNSSGGWCQPLAGSEPAAP